MTTTAVADTEIPHRATELFKAIFYRVRAVSTFQRYWDYLPEIDRTRAGCEIEKAYETYRNAARLHQQRRGVSEQRAYVEVALITHLVYEEDAKWLLRLMGESLDNIEATIDQAITAGHLVLIERPRAAHWRGDQIAIEWDRHQASWNYLWQLARASKAGMGLDCTAFAEQVSRDYLTKQKSRLINQLKGFPFELGELIVNADAGEHRLDIDRAKIRIFESDCASNLREALG